MPSEDNDTLVGKVPLLVEDRFPGRTVGLSKESSFCPQAMLLGNKKDKKRRCGSGERRGVGRSVHAYSRFGSKSAGFLS